MNTIIFKKIEFSKTNSFPKKIKDKDWLKKNIHYDLLFKYITHDQRYRGSEDTLTFKTLYKIHTFGITKEITDIDFFLPLYELQLKLPSNIIEKRLLIGITHDDVLLNIFEASLERNGEIVKKFSYKESPDCLYSIEKEILTTLDSNYWYEL